MISVSDAQLLTQFEAAQHGVFSKADLQTILAEAHPAGFTRRIRSLIDQGVIRRFKRGWYVTEQLDLPTLSQRLAPNSIISFSTVLARKLIIGPRPERHIIAVTPGKARRYECDDLLIEHVHVTDALMFGFINERGIRYADAEKAVLDALYFHLRGRRYPFDIYSDIDTDKLDPKRLRKHLKHYKNSKFVTFTKSILELA